MNHEEHRIQVSIARYLDIALPEGCIYFAVPNGGARPTKTRKTRGGSVTFSPEAARLKREGVKAGVADIMVIDGSGRDLCVIALEVKTEKGRLSDSQKEWTQKATGAGVSCYVVRSIEDAALALRKEGVQLRAIPSTAPGRLYEAV